MCIKSDQIGTKLYQNSATLERDKISCYFCDSETKLPYNVSPGYTNCKLVCRSPVKPTRTRIAYGGHVC